jgi:hypothetical protein
MVAELTRHHLIPRCRRDRRRRRADPQAELVTVDLCRPCHHHIHTVCSEAELERTYPTLSALAAHPEVAAFIAWIARRPDGAHVPAASKKRR